MSPDDLRQQIEAQVVELLQKRLTEGKITQERSQEISQLVLDALQPGMALEALYKAIPKLDDTAPELSPIILPILADYERQVMDKTTQGVGELIRQGQYDAAQKLAKRAISQDVSLLWEGTGRPGQSSS